jgi:hypothetical protein
MFLMILSGLVKMKAHGPRSGSPRSEKHNPIQNGASPSISEKEIAFISEMWIFHTPKEPEFGNVAPRCSYDIYDKCRISSLCCPAIVYDLV